MEEGPTGRVVEAIRSGRVWGRTSDSPCSKTEPAGGPPASQIEQSHLQPLARATGRCGRLGDRRLRRGALEPGFEGRLAEPCVIAGKQCSLAEFRSSVKRVWVGDDFSGIL